MSVKKLRPYFQAHIIVVLTGYPIRTILHKPDALGRLLKWEVELSEFEIVYHSRLAIKGPVLTEFIAEMSNMPKDAISEPLWILETNGSYKVVREKQVWCCSL